jgi:hypothetical protein
VQSLIHNEVTGCVGYCHVGGFRRVEVEFHFSGNSALVSSRR